ncbi:hypothetical protein [Pseudomonas sp. TE50-2]|uniref:hypothetical protein n=1 Tax=Pseudomonas sp. TE50-2 TaxID=3142707 RepID=UPI0034657C3D
MSKLMLISGKPSEVDQSFVGLGFSKGCANPGNPRNQWSLPGMRQMAMPEKRQSASASNAAGGNCRAVKAAKQKFDVMQARLFAIDGYS